MADKEYRTTMFDRGGADAIHGVRVWAYAFMIFGIAAGGLFLTVGFKWWVIPVAIAGGLLGVSGGVILSAFTGSSVKHLMVSGASTPYAEQYSYQQSLVMKGELDAALASFEAVIAEQPRAVTARVKAAELYTRDKKNHERAAELFREIQRMPAVSSGDYVYATNRLVDLLIGPLGEPGRARVELRKLMERIPGSPAAANARIALAELRSRENS